MEEQNQLTVKPMPFEEMDRLAISAANSKMFGITNKDQALCLFAICQAENLHPVQALRRYHLIEGKPSMRADAMQGEFMARGGKIIWHVRTDDMVAATFSMKARSDDPFDSNAFRDRAIKRFDLLWKLEAEEDPTECSAIMVELAKLSVEGEETIIRTYEDAEAKNITQSWKDGKWVTKHNWKQSPRQMLTARVITEGVRLINPGLIAGIYSPDEIQDIITAEVRDRDEFVAGALKEPDPRDRKAIQAMIDQYVEDAKTAKGARKSELLGLASELRVQLQDMDLETDEIPGIAPAASKSELPVAAEAELHLIGEEGPKEIPWQDYVLQHVKSKTLSGKKLGSFSAADIKVIYNKIGPALDSPDPKIRLEAHYIKLAHKAMNPEEK